MANRNSDSRVVSVLVDNPSWVLPYAERLTDILNKDGDDAIVCRSHEDIREGYAALLMGCTKIARPETLARNKYNLVVHSSDLPLGRGNSPLTWQIIEGKNEVPVCLFEAVEKIDRGDIFYRETLNFQGHELIDDLRNAYGESEIRLFTRFMREGVPAEREKQVGQGSYYPKRGPVNSELNITQSIASQFDLMRTVDNEKYPLFFKHRGHEYTLKIDKASKDGKS
jgi:methionyl-tRNA formyltransferase